MSDHLASITGDYAIDPSHSQIGFSVRHAMVTTVRGSFGVFESKAHIDAEQPGNSSVTVSIETASISTGSADRDGHLSSPDFFDAAAYPQITFASTDVARDGDEWTITGDLTIKDVTRPVTIVFEQVGTAKDPFGNTRVGFEGGVTISRKDWGLSWNAALETGGVLVSDAVKLSFDISAVRAEG
ncbi:MAG: YceI family protein [Nocardioides sp.]